MAKEFSKLSDKELDDLIAQNQPNADFSSLSDEALDKQIQELSVSDKKVDSAKNALLAAQEGGTFGLSPLIAGVGGAVGKAAGTFSNLKDLPISERISEAVSSLPSGFREGRAEQKAEEAQALQESPGLYRSVSFGSGLLSGGGIGAAAKGGLLGAGKIAKAAQVLANPSNTLSGAVKAGTASGALQAAGRADTPLEAAGLVGGGALSGVIGHGIGVGASKALAPSLEKASNSLDKAADKWAFSALRGYKKDVKKAFQKGEVEEIGRELHDSGLLSGIPKSVEKLAEAARSKEKELGSHYGSILKQIDDVAGPTIERQVVGNKVREALKADESLGILSKEFNDEVSSFVRKFESSQAPMTLTQAKQMRKSLEPFTKWNANFQNGIPVEVQAARQLYHALNEAADETAEALSGQVGLAKDVVPMLRDKIYKLKTASTIAEGRSLGEVANRFVSPSDYGIGAMGAILNQDRGLFEGGLTGAALGLLNKGAREYGSQITSRAARKGAGLLGSAAGLLKDKKITPAESVLINKLIQSGIPPTDALVEEEKGLLRNRKSASKDQ